MKLAEILKNFWVLLATGATLFVALYFFPEALCGLWVIVTLGIIVLFVRYSMEKNKEKEE